MSIDSKDLTGQAAIVTGSTQGLGEAVARRLLRCPAFKYGKDTGKYSH